MDSYIVVFETSLPTLVRVVNQKITEGYTPVGGIAVPDSIPGFYQSMFKVPVPKVDPADIADYEKTGIRSV